MTAGFSENKLFRKRFLTRRKILVGAGFVFVDTAISNPSIWPLHETRELILSAALVVNSQEHSLVWFDPDKNAKPSHFLAGFRGHSILQNPNTPNSFLVLSRRPGTIAIEVNTKSSSLVGGFECGSGRHLFGHGCFSSDGNYLFTTESDYANGRGLVVVRDAVDYRVLDEWSSGGIGPHEIRLLPDGGALVVANGGILTHPDRGRTPLNLDSMASNLAYIDSTSGELLDYFQVPEMKASIRHIDVSKHGAVAFAMQLQRSVAGHDRVVPLAGVHRPSEKLTLFDYPREVVARLNDYTGGVAISNPANVAAYACPRGNLAVFWNFRSGKYLGYHALTDVCGVASSLDESHFVLTNSFGQVRWIDAFTLKESRSSRIQKSDIRWDNHLLIARADG